MPNLIINFWLSEAFRSWLIDLPATNIRRDTRQIDERTDRQTDRQSVVHNAAGLLSTELNDKSSPTETQPIEAVIRSHGLLVGLTSAPALDSHAAVWGVGGGVSTRHGRRRRRADEVASAAAAAT